MTKTETNKATPFDTTGDEATKQDLVANMLQGLQYELDKLKGKVHGGEHVVNLAQVNE